jgi:hypothetical protein
LANTFLVAVVSSGTGADVVGSKALRGETGEASRWAWCGGAFDPSPVGGGGVVRAVEGRAGTEPIGAVAADALEPITGDVAKRAEAIATTVQRRMRLWRRAGG